MTPAATWLLLERGALYRVLTRRGRVYDAMRWSPARMAFQHRGTVIPLEAVERVAPRTRIAPGSPRYLRAGGEAFVSIDRCRLAPAGRSTSLSPAPEARVS